MILKAFIIVQTDFIKYKYKIIINAIINLKLSKCVLEIQDGVVISKSKVSTQFHGMLVRVKIPITIVM